MRNQTVSELVKKLYQEAKRHKDANEINNKPYTSILEKIGEVEEEFAEL